MADKRPRNHVSDVVSKVPQVTRAFWVIKICATTLGETGGDALSMTLKLGYAVSTVIFAAIFVAGVAAQIVAKRYHPFIYWLVIVATTTKPVAVTAMPSATLSMLAAAAHVSRHGWVATTGGAYACWDNPEQRCVNYVWLASAPTGHPLAQGGGGNDGPGGHLRAGCTLDGEAGPAVVRHSVAVAREVAGAIGTGAELADAPDDPRATDQP